MIHLTTHQLSSYLDRELPESSTELVRRHLDGCEECTRRFAAFREQEAILDRVLAHDPGEEFFARFANQVLGEPEPNAALSAPAAQAANARREAPPPPACVPRPARSQPAIPWFAAAILCLIVGAIGYMLPRPVQTPDMSGPGPGRAADSSRPGPLRAPTAPGLPGVQAADEPPAHSPMRESTEESVHAPQMLPAEGSIVPVRRIITTTMVRSAQVARSAQAPPSVPRPPSASPPDEFAGAPPPVAPLIAAARKASEAAALDSSAANLDAVGNAWEQVVPALGGVEQTIARQDLAEARYRAWLAAPDPYRAAAATASLRTFLVLSPPGPSRDLAKTWLRRINGG